MTKRSRQFQLIRTEDFDARRGYSRWIMPGVGVRTTERGSLAQADVWIDRLGLLVTRFTSQGYVLSYKIRELSRRPITPAMKEDIESFLVDMLMTWTAEGVDDELECDDVVYDNETC